MIIDDDDDDDDAPYMYPHNPTIIAYSPPLTHKLS
jgi:hypothetical protein